MGLNITQHTEDGWKIKIVEEWLVDTFEDALKLMDRLMLIGIEYKVTYSFEMVHVHIEGAIVERKKYEDFQKVLKELLDFKRKYGHGVK
jgi:hypothetical protein